MLLGAIIFFLATQALSNSPACQKIYLVDVKILTDNKTESVAGKTEFFIKRATVFYGHYSKLGILKPLFLPGGAQKFNFGKVDEVIWVECEYGTSKEFDGPIIRHNLGKPKQCTFTPQTKIFDCTW